MFFTTQLNAQKENSIVYGILVEYQNGKINFDDDLNDFDLETSGVAIGILAEAPIAKSLLFGIQPKIVLGESKFRSLIQLLVHNKKLNKAT